MQVMGIAGICPKRNLSKADKTHEIYPYLLKGLTITKPNQVWETDITYIKMVKGFCYLTAILDWFSRYVVSWEISATMEKEFCMTSLRSALKRVSPEIHNSDQGSQFTSKEYLALLEAQKIMISMDGRGRCMDNIFTERLWKSVKYEEVYLKEYRTMEEAREGLMDYFPFYNEKRRHQGLKDKTPAEVYYAGH